MLISSLQTTPGAWGAQALYDAIKAHMNVEILLITAAGNSAANNDTTFLLPASYYLPNILAVAASDHTEVRSWLSNYVRSAYGPRRRSRRGHLEHHPQGINMTSLAGFRWPRRV